MALQLPTAPAQRDTLATGIASLWRRLPIHLGVPTCPRPRSSLASLHHRYTRLATAPRKFDHKPDLDLGVGQYCLIVLRSRKR